MNHCTVYRLKCGVTVDLLHIAAIVPVQNNTWELIVHQNRISVESCESEIGALSWAWSCAAVAHQSKQSESVACRTD